MQTYRYGTVGIIAALLFSAAGCQHRAPANRPPAPSFQINAVVKPGDPVPHPIYLVQLDVYQMDLPLGAVSENAGFWGHTSLENISPGVAELLNKNGFRIGQGRVADWAYFRKILEKNPVHTQVSSRVAYQEQREPLLTRSNQPPRNLFYYDASGQLIGRSFGESDDIMLLSFWPTPRHNGQVHIQLIPAVRSGEEQFQKQWTEGRESISPVRPEFFYELALEADLDVNHFFIVAPSSAAKLPTSLGGAFMVDSANGGRKETVLIFVARPIGAPALLRSN